MMHRAATVTLAASAYSMRRLTLRQLRALGFGSPAPVVSGDDPAELVRRYEHMAETVAAAIEHDHPDISAETLFGMEITGPELLAAYRAVLAHSGLVLKAEQPSFGAGGIDWGDLFGLCCTALAKTPREIGELTLPELDELLAYWRDHPPLHVLAAAYLGVKPQPKIADYAPATRISPSLVPDDPDRPRPAPAPFNDPSGMGALIAAAKARGGQVSMDMLIGMAPVKH
jgi:hypothetical protein